MAFRFTEVDSMMKNNQIEKQMLKLSMSVEETTEAFIFRTISPFVDDLAGYEVKKEELVRAVKLLRMDEDYREKYGDSLINKAETNSLKESELKTAYNRGYSDGIKAAREKFESMFGDILSVEEKDD